MKFLKKFYTFVCHFALLDSDPDSKYGSGSSDPIESGFDWDPDPQPCFKSTIFRRSSTLRLPLPLLRRRKLLTYSPPSHKRK
jgi:hypothetical protein